MKIEATAINVAVKGFEGLVSRGEVKNQPACERSQPASIQSRFQRRNNPNRKIRPAEIVQSFFI